MPGDIWSALSRGGQAAYNLYGPTETTIWSTVSQLTVGQGPTIGGPIANTRLYVLDGGLGPAPIGVAGELYIGGVGLARGYAHRAGLTADRFIPSPFGDGERLYRTGDLARWRSDGELEYLGRLDHQVKLRGYRIELGEIETALRGWDGLSDAVVVAREDAPGDKRLVAYVVAAAAAVADAGALRAHLKQSLPDYMVPSAFVVLESLPLTPNGKLDRKALPAPDAAAVVRGEYVAPRTAVEEVLASIWCEVLKLDRVGVLDNFFELGGHSLLAMRLVARVRDEFEVELALRALFAAPSVGELALRVEAAQREGLGLAVPALVVQRRPDGLPLSYAQERLWLLEQIEAAGSAYNLSAAVRLRGPLDVEALSRSFATIVERHEALRTRFEVVDGGPVQVIGEAGLFRLELEDLSGLAEQEREGNALRWTSAYVRRPFDLERGGLLRAAVLRLSEEEHVAIVVMHHIVSDGWSIGVLIREVEALYGAYSRGQGSPLAALPVQYADYAVWQRSWLHGEVLEKQVAYWKERLAGAPAALELPTDRPRPSVQSFSGASVWLGLSKDLIDALQAIARSEGATLFMVLVAAFQLLLSRWSGQSDVVVGTPVAGRTHRQSEGLIGFFVNMLPLRTDLSGDPSFRELLGRVKETALGAYAHQDLPFEKLVEELQPVRDLSRRPIFQVMINSFLEENPRSLSLPGLQISALGSGEVSARFELMLRLMEAAQGVSCGFEYATDLFAEATIEHLAGQFGTLLGGLVQRPDAAVSELEVLGPAERLQLLAWSAKAADYLSGSDVIARIGAHRSGDGGDPLQGLQGPGLQGPGLQGPGLQGYVLDRWLGLAAVGVIGELYIGGTEPWDDGDGPALTASRFIPDPFGSGQRLYRTGELARWRADGVLEIVDGAGDGAGSAATADDAAAVAYEAPRTPLEELLAGIWVETLGVDRVGVHDNFFELGGHSLLATRLMARVRDEFEVELALRALFAAPSVGELALRVEAAQREGLGAGSAALVVQRRPDGLPLSYAQERLWLLEQIGGVGTAYHMPAAVRLQGDLDVVALERSFATIVERHEGLRTRFAVVDGGPVQVIEPAGLFGLQVEDLSELPECERDASARQRMHALMQHRFDLERGPLFRATLVRLSREEHVAIVVMHHILSDGWSIGVLIREVGALYAAYSPGARPSPLPEPAGAVRRLCDLAARLACRARCWISRSPTGSSGWRERRRRWSCRPTGRVPRCRAIVAGLLHLNCRGR